MHVRTSYLPLILFSLLISSGCAITPTGSQSAGQLEQRSGEPAARVQVSENIEVNPIIHDEISVEEIQQKIEENDDLLSDTTAGGRDDSAPLQVPLEINRKVAWWIHYLTVRDGERISRFFERGSKMRKHIHKILEENGLPKEFFYLAMIESGFVEHAKSRASAVGVWQFMKRTGQAYGLQVNYMQDERRHWIKATEAAASYLKDLHNVFGSWYLAIASYNAGEHRIVRSIMRGKTRDFWALAEGKMLPKETLNYVPKFLAAIIIGKNPKRYGINYIEQDPLPKYTTVSVPGGVNLRSLAKATNVPYDVIKQWNVDLRRGLTPYGDRVELYVPKDYEGNFEDNKDAIAKLKRRKGKSRYWASRSNRSGYRVYVVRRGDTLSQIAESLGISLRSLKRLNHIRRSRIHHGQRLKYYTSRSRRTPTAVASGNVYTVRRNDTLFGIARRHRVSIRQLKRTNGMRGSRIYPGQRLIIPGRKAASRGSQRARSRGRTKHKIRRGENLHVIARRYDVTVQELKKINRLKSSEIYAGQVIRVK